jgi:hypothetical protein
MNESSFTNRLINENSPYLLQHAHNPVNWYSWCDEAFNIAKKENKPIFLSIGYSTCHWCHVMAHESFEDEDVAKILNDNYISIKVDKEERPDIDNIYMEVSQALTGTGGWPLTIIMTPEQKPFYAATYLPKNSKGQHIGLIDVLLIVKDKWLNQKEEIVNSASGILEKMQEIVKTSKEGSNRVCKDNFKDAYNQLIYSFDHVYGGFGNAPKFPTPHKLLYLLRYHVVKGDDQSLNMVEKTLLQMYKGGIFDHIGYGFSRYSTDKKWLVPHFEKMLYDNALLAVTYLEAYLLTNNEIYKEILNKILKFVSEEMLDSNGGFYTAIDADLEGKEGEYYLWDYDELKGVLDNDEFKLFVDYYQVAKEGNFEGKNIVNLIHKDRITTDSEEIKKIQAKLLKIRRLRVQPHKDDKILTSLNGMMIVAYAMSGKYLNKNEYINIAQKAADFIINNLINKDGRLLARYRNNEAKYLGYLNDYAYFIYGLTELYLATNNETYLSFAHKLSDDMIDLFYDKENGGFFYSGNDAEKLILNYKEIYDGAIPSSNSMATLDLLRLGYIIDEYKYEKVACEQYTTFSSIVKSNPSAYMHFLSTYLLKVKGLNKIVFIYKNENEEVKDIKKLLLTKYAPFSEIIILSKNNLTDSKYFELYQHEKSDLILHICVNNICEEPLRSYDDIIEYLQEEWRY